MYPTQKLMHALKKTMDGCMSVTTLLALSLFLHDYCLFI